MGNSLKLQDKFTFSCHAGLSCFKKCCRDINIFLTPYDVLRIKNYLKISSEEFLTGYTHVLRTPNVGFPVVILKMREDNLVCPFVSDLGCTIYQVRPWSCRMAPIEVRRAGEYGVAFDKARCLGLNETKEWTVQEWMDNQGLAAYEEPEKCFSQIPLQIKLTGDKELDLFIMQLILLGCYNLDEFRSMLKSHPVLTQDVPEPQLQKIMADDVALMKFAFKWLPDRLGNLQKLLQTKHIIEVN
ncbi:YkgJ family cysteine cluster protein [Desulfotomaculum varum]